MIEHPKRTIFKTLTWRVIAVSVTVAAVYLYTGKIEESLVVGISANAVKMFLYYIHERIWNKVSFGRGKPPEYTI